MKRLPAALLLVCFVFFGSSTAEMKAHEAGGFVIEHEIILPGAPEVIYDAMTGDISGWWDHSFSDSPKKFYIEPKPGGGFWEIFDDEGNGVLHATVIYADRGKRLAFDGPLGLSGRAFQLVVTYKYEPLDSTTKLSSTVNLSGQITEKEAGVVDSVWHHFLFEGLKPYIEAGKHLE